MSDLQTTVSLTEIRGVLLSWLERQLDTRVMEWLAGKTESFRGELEEWEFFSAFSSASRHTGKQPLELTGPDLKRAGEIRPGWQPGHWTVDETARILIMLSVADRDEAQFLDLLDKTFDSSDMGEAVALYKSTAILPYPERLRDRAAEGVRSNITSVYHAVAHWNPYPVEFFDDTAWNQMVLKALFVDSVLFRIHGFDRRANAELARMLTDFAHERWSAGREVPPELWRAVGPFAEGDLLRDIAGVLDHPDPLHRSAAVLALESSRSPEAGSLLGRHSALVSDPSRLKTWDDIGRAVLEQRQG